MPLGDSVTAGTGSSTGIGGYPYTLAQLLDLAGQPYDFVGSMSSSSTIDNNHEGHGGYRSQDILNGTNPDTGLSVPGEGVANWLKLNPPDVVLLMVGYNDIFKSVPVADYTANLNAILDSIRSAKSQSGQSIKVLLATLGAVTGSQTQLDAMNAAIINVYNQRKVQGNLYLVDMRPVITGSGDLSDNVHPNDSGYIKMASAWMQGLRTAGLAPAVGALKIMPVGDSLTAGKYSTDGGGYRKDLYSLLNNAGVSFTFVGSKADGQFGDPDHEGYNLYTTEDVLHGTVGGSYSGQVKEAGPGIATRLTQYKPDVVLLLIGTNDVLGGGMQLSTSSANITGILDAVKAFSTSQNKPVKTLLATLPPVTSVQQSQISAFNDAINGIVQQRAAQGNLWKVDLSHALAAGDYSTQEPVAHPNDAGYTKLANRWFAGLQTAGVAPGTPATFDTDTTGSTGGTSNTGGTSITGAGGSSETTTSSGVSSSSGGGGGGGCSMQPQAGFDPTLPLLVLAGLMMRLMARRSGSAEA